MAFTTGPDFLSGILGASNSTNVLNRFRSDTGQEDFYQGLQGNRYGERIGDDGYVGMGPFTMDVVDSDRDGIDDRHQVGPGQPRVGANPDSPLFGGGNLPPNAGGGGGGGDNPNSPMNNRRVADYNPNLVGQYVGYNNPEYGMGLTYNNSSNVDPANETGFLNGFDFKNLLPGSFVAKGLAKGIGALEKNFFPESVKANLDKLTPEAFKARYGDFMNKYGTEDEDEDAIDYGLRARELGLLGPTSYETNQAAATENSLANIAYKDEVNALAEVDPALRKRLTSFGEDLSISDYNTALSEFTPTENFPSLTTTNPLAAYQQAQKESQAEKDFQRQQNINNAVASGDFIGTGYNSETGNYGGLLTNTNSNSGTSVTSNVQTGPYSGAALSGAIQNENFNNMMANRREKNNQSGQNDGNESQSQGQHAGSGHRLGR